MEKIKYNSTIQDLDGEDWGQPQFPSHVVTECHRLRQIPLREMTIENVCLMIGQSVGLEYLVPLALEYVGKNPWTEGDSYAGDLMLQLLRIPDYWADHPEQLDELNDAIHEMRAQSERFISEIEPAWQKLYS